MSTQPLSPNSQPDPTSATTDDELAAAALLKQVHEDLARFGVEPDALACVALGDTELVIGEVYDHKDYLEGENHASIFQHAPFVSLKDPKRLTRLQVQNRQTGAVGVQILIVDYDFVEAGIIEVKPLMAFFFDWCDFGTQLRYCKAYLSFLEGRRKARSRLVLPNPPAVGPAPR